MAINDVWALFRFTLHSVISFLLPITAQKSGQHESVRIHLVLRQSCVPSNGNAVKKRNDGKGSLGHVVKVHAKKLKMPKLAPNDLVLAAIRERIARR